jgi:hypothetical protein
MDHPTNVPAPTLQELERARADYERREPRDLFYRAATELVKLAIRDPRSLSLAEALAVLLQTWNRAYYQYHHRRFDARHFSDIEELVRCHERRLLDNLRRRSIDGLADADEAETKALFAEFEQVLGPVGAAKALHLIAPRFFPLWDRAIAEVVYHLPMKRQGLNRDNYWRFMSIAKEQCARLGGEKAVGRNPLKALDEYNYIKSHPK